MPSALTTGVPAGTSLSAYTGPNPVTVAGTVIDGKSLTVPLTISAANVTVKNSKIRADGFTLIDCQGQSGCRIERCTLDGKGATAGSYAINGKGTFVANNIFGVENGIAPETGSVVQGNFIHGLQAGGPDPHYDGIAIHGGNSSNITITGNYVRGRDNASLYLTNDFGSISNVVADGNWFGVENTLTMGNTPNANPPVYTVYVVGGKAGGGTITGVQITNNVVEKGIYGSIEIETATVTKSGNVDMNGNAVTS
jgi:hypothetical protein